MKYSLLCFLYLIISLTFLSCSNPSSSDSIEVKFGFYLLANDTLSTKDVQDKPLSSLAIKSYPIITYGDIIKYDTAVCKIYLQKPFNKYFGSDSLTMFSEYFGTPFIIVANDESVYLGSFYPMESSWMSNTPIISSSDLNAFEKSVTISYYIQGSPDMRKDKRIIEALKDKIM